MNVNFDELVGWLLAVGFLFLPEIGCSITDDHSSFLSVVGSQLSVSVCCVILYIVHRSLFVPLTILPFTILPLTDHPFTFHLSPLPFYRSPFYLLPFYRSPLTYHRSPFYLYHSFTFHLFTGHPFTLFNPTLRSKL